MSLLTKARSRLIVREEFYGTFCSMMEFKPSTRIPTAGVRILRSGIIECLYNPEFITKLGSVERIYSLLKHEVEHIINMHPLRQGERDNQAWNLACDMAVNGKRTKPRIGYEEAGSPTIVVMDECIWIPEDWESNLSSEEYYDKLPHCPDCGAVCAWDSNTGEAKGEDGQGDKDDKKDGDEGEGDAEGDGEGQEKPQENQEGTGGGSNTSESNDGQGNDTPDKGKCPTCGALPSLSDCHDTWKDSEVSEDEARQIVKGMVESAAQAAGTTPGHLERAIEELNKPIVRWREILKNFTGRHAGGKRVTYARRNRRHRRFGVPGYSERAVANVGVVIDTSGSIGNEILKVFFSEIEGMVGRAKVWCLCWDAGFGSFHKTYRRGDWKNIEMKGGGGTNMGAAIEWGANNAPANAIVVLTDGHTPWCEKPQIPIFVALTEENDTPEWAQSILIK